MLKVVSATLTTLALFQTSITHSDNSQKTMVALTWTAPPAGTGTVLLRYAMVDSQPVYWANQPTDPINEVTMDTETISPSPVIMSTSTDDMTTGTNDVMATTTDDVIVLPTNVPADDTMTSTSTTSDVTMSPTGSADDDDDDDDDDSGAPGVMAASSVLIMLLAGIITLIN